MMDDDMEELVSASVIVRGLHVSASATATQPASTRPKKTKL